MKLNTWYRWRSMFLLVTWKHPDVRVKQWRGVVVTGSRLSEVSILAGDLDQWQEMPADIVPVKARNMAYERVMEQRAHSAAQIEDAAFKAVVSGQHFQHYAQRNAYDRAVLLQDAIETLQAEFARVRKEAAA